MKYDIEINFDEAKELAKDGSSIYVFTNGPADLEFVKAMFDKDDNIYSIDFNEARVIAFSYKDRDLSSQYGLKYSNAVLVCPHGNTSLRFAKSLLELGIPAYSLKGGIAGLKVRD